MAEITRSYEFVIMAAGSTTTADLTFTDDDFVEPPEYSTWDVDLFEARAESVPFQVEVLDTSGQVTGALSDADGRVDVMGRYWRLRVNENGGGLTTVATGRLVGVRMSPTLGSYLFECGDEMYLARNYDIYTSIATPTTRIWPPGLREVWRAIPAAPLGQLEVESTDTSRADSQNAVHLLPNVGAQFALSPQVVEWLKLDIKSDVSPGVGASGVGNFTNLRFRTSSTDYEVLTFSASLNNLDFLGALDGEDPAGSGDGALRRFLDLWIAWPSGSQPTAGDFLDGELYAPNAPASPTLPYHLGTGAGSGVDLYSTWKDHLDDAGIEYDTNAFSAWNASTNPDGMLARPLVPRGHRRITGPMKLSTFGEEVMRDTLAAPFQNGTGQLMPRPIHLPNDITVSGLTQITSADFTREGHPTFRIVGTKVKNVLQARVQSFRAVSLRNEDSDWPADKIVQQWVDLPPFEHDNVADIGRHVLERDFLGVSALTARGFSTELFARFGDGPIEGAWETLSAMNTINPGDYVRVNLSSYPDMDSQARGGIRVVQVLQKETTPFGTRMEYLDAGSDDNALTAPTVTVAQNASRTKHDIDVTIGSMPAAATKYILEAQIGTADFRYVGEGTANETVTIYNFPANTNISFRAKAIAPGRVGSAWSTEDNVTTAALTAPSAVTATIDGRSVVLTWTNGETDYPIELLIDSVVQPIYFSKPGWTRYVFNGLAASTSITFGVRHVDPYGGVSTTATDTETTGTAQTLTAPRSIIDRALTITDVYPPDNRYGSGIEIGVVTGDPHAHVEIQVDDNSSFTSPDTYFVESRDAMRIPLPLDDTTRYVRARHQRTGFTASSWTDTLQMKPQPFSNKESVGPTDRKRKTIRFPASAALMFSESEQWNVNPGGILNPGALATQLDGMIPIVIPEGAVIKEFRCRYRRNDAGDTVQVSLTENDNDGSETVIVTLTPATTGASLGSAEDTTLSTTVAAPGTYLGRFALTADNSTLHAGLLYIELVYEQPTTQESI